MDILQILFTDSFWAATLRIATPLIFGVLGALICEKSGVLNLGIEGIFVAGAMAGWMAVWLGAGLWGGLMVAAMVGGFFWLDPRHINGAAGPVAACIGAGRDDACHFGQLFYVSHGVAQCFLAA